MTGDFAPGGGWFAKSGHFQLKGLESSILRFFSTPFLSKTFGLFRKNSSDYLRGKAISETRRHIGPCDRHYCRRKEAGAVRLRRA